MELDKIIMNVRGLLVGRRNKDEAQQGFLKTELKEFTKHLEEIKASR